MPEGDTIHRTAATLRRVLGGRILTRVELPRVIPPILSIGSTVDDISARGKHLLIGTSDGLVLHTHQRMTGSWHVYRPGERWQRSPRTARAVLGVDGAVAVCFSAPVVEVMDLPALDHHPVLGRLGPDLSLGDVDLDRVMARIGRFHGPEAAVADILLDQRVASGVGNVFRSEVLFLTGLHPVAPIGALTDDACRAVFTTAAELLRRNLRTSRRTTVPGGGDGSLWVYGRAGLPCRRCGATLKLRRSGDHHRTVFWCPHCQPATD